MPWGLGIQFASACPRFPPVGLFFEAVRVSPPLSKISSSSTAERLSAIAELLSAERPTIWTVVRPPVLALHRTGSDVSALLQGVRGRSAAPLDPLAGLERAVGAAAGRWKRPPPRLSWGISAAAGQGFTRIEICAGMEVGTRMASTAR